MKITIELEYELITGRTPMGESDIRSRVWENLDFTDMGITSVAEDSDDEVRTYKFIGCRTVSVTGKPFEIGKDYWSGEE